MTINVQGWELRPGDITENGREVKRVLPYRAETNAFDHCDGAVTVEFIEGAPTVVEKNGRLYPLLARRVNV